MNDMLSDDEKAFANSYYNESLAGISGLATAWLVSRGVKPNELMPLNYAMRYVYGANWEPGEPSTSLNFPWSSGAELRERMRQLAEQLRASGSDCG